MLDLIIPVYKNKAGLYRTLMSIGTELKDQVLVTIVDDASDENYDDVIQLFQKIFPIRVLTLEQNSGPGIARQYGLDRATQKWVAFIDCGDTFLTSTTLLEMLSECEATPNLWMASWAHQEELTTEDPTLPYFYKIVGPEHNRMHGKMYLRQFLLNYGITFCEEMPRANEDIGFNLSARLLCYNATLQDGIQHMYQYDAPAVVWKVHGPSIVRADNCQFYYRRQNIGMAYNAVHVLKKLLEQNVDKNIILREIYEEIAHMYCFYLITSNSRPEFTDEAIEGAKYYYIHAFYEVKDKDVPLLQECYWNTLCGFFSDRDNPICTGFTKLDFAGWLDWMEEITKEEREKLQTEVEQSDIDKTTATSDFQFEKLT